jgi:putative ABC transport system permease protein
VTNLLLVRAERRQPDLVLRAALGATRARLVRELVAESILLSLAGAAVGLLFASWCVGLLIDLYGAVLPRSWEIELHAGILLAACGIAVAAGVAVAILPAMRLPRATMRGALTQDRVQSRATGSQRVLIALETAIAMLLLALAGLVVNTVARLSSHDLGLRAEGAVLFDVGFTGRFPSSDAGLDFLDRLTVRLRALPGVAHVAAASRRPLFGGNNSSFVIAGQETPPLLEIREVTPDYFAALGIPLRSGRLLTATDRATAHVVVNRAFERAHFPAATAIGQRLRSATGNPRWFEVAGVVDDVREFGPAADPRPTVYFAYGSGPYGMSTAPVIIVRVASGDPMNVVSPARAVLRELDADVALDDPITLAAQAQSRIGRDRLAVRALLSLAGRLFGGAPHP